MFMLRLKSRLSVKPCRSSALLLNDWMPSGAEAEEAADELEAGEDAAASRICRLSMELLSDETSGVEAGPGVGAAIELEGDGMVEREG